MQTDAAVPDDTRTFTAVPAGRHTLTDPEAPEEGDVASGARPAREGLPKSYRSRHDRHYVEQLTSATSMPLLRMLAVSRIDAAQLPDPSEVAALTASIGRLGVLQPLLVRAQGDRFVLIAGRRRLVAARQAHCREVPCLVHTVDDARASELAEAANSAAAEQRERTVAQRAVDVAHSVCDTLSDAMLPEIDHALTSVHRSLRLLPQSPATTRERVAMRLTAAELERAQWLVRCRRYLAGGVPVATRRVPLPDLAREIRNIGNGVTLHGGHFDVDVTGAPPDVIADAALLSAAVHGLVWALLALGETAHDPTVRVTLSGGALSTGALSIGALSGGAAAALSVTQPTAVLNQPMLLRFFEAGTKGRPGGPSTELAVQLARYAAARHGAEIEVSSGPATGTTVTMSLR